MFLNKNALLTFRFVLKQNTRNSGNWICVYIFIRFNMRGSYYDVYTKPCYEYVLPAKINWNEIGFWHKTFPIIYGVLWITMMIVASM